MNRLLKSRMFVSVFLSAVLTFAFVFAIAYSATTISTNISTGNLTVTGTAGITGVTTMVNASTTQALTVAGATYLNGGVQFNGFATTTGSNGNIATEGTLTVTGATTLNGGLTMSTTKFSVNTSGLASSTSLRVGSGSDVSTVSGLSFGFCNMPTVTVNASSTAYGICTPNTASSINSSSLVFVQATSSLLTNFIIQAASSTAAGTISVQIFNSGMIAGTATGQISLNFIGIR